MTFVRTTDADLFYGRLNAEQSRIPGFPVVSRAALEVRNSHDILLVNPIDNLRVDGRGAVAWITADNWSAPTYLAAQQVWGPSTFDNGDPRHLEILIDICAWAVTQDLVQEWRQVFGPGHLLADQPIRIGIVGMHPLVTIATNILIPLGVMTVIQPAGIMAEATMRSALAPLIGARV